MAVTNFPFNIDQPKTFTASRNGAFTNMADMADNHINQSRVRTRGDRDREGFRSAQARSRGAGQASKWIGGKRRQSWPWKSPPRKKKRRKKGELTTKSLISISNSSGDIGKREYQAAGEGNLSINGAHSSSGHLQQRADEMGSERQASKRDKGADTSESGRNLMNHYKLRRGKDSGGPVQAAFNGGRAEKGKLGTVDGSARRRLYPRGNREKLGRQKGLKVSITVVRGVVTKHLLTPVGEKATKGEYLRGVGVSSLDTFLPRSKPIAKLRKDKRDLDKREEKPLESLRDSEVEAMEMN
ncbi:unnamed protein product [Linum trigynum]|uniref:Uncharacterized protein n=1 Tax=Linum trigynum TaxID=586398 RepID=A0AAV2FWG0_9ROSI